MAILEFASKLKILFSFKGKFGSKHALFYVIAQEFDEWLFNLCEHRST